MLNHSLTATHIPDRSEKKGKTKIFLKRRGGTGTGFRKAVKSWYNNYTNSVEKIRELMPFITFMTITF